MEGTVGRNSTGHGMFRELGHLTYVSDIEVFRKE